MKQNHGFAPIIGIIFGAVVLVGGGLIAAQYLGTANVPERAPEEVLSEAIGNFFEQKSFAFDLKTDLDIQPKANADLNLPQVSDAEKFSGKIRLAGSLDFYDDLNPKMGSVLDIDIFAPAKDPKDNMAVKGKIEMRLLDRNLFLKLSPEKLPEDLMMFASFLSNVWIRLDASDISNTTGAEIDDRALQEQQKEYRDAFARFIKTHKILKITTVLDAESVDGMAAYHYKVSVDKDALVKAVPDMAKELNQIAAKHQTGKQMTSDEIKKVQADIQKTRFQDVEIWIGAKDILPRKISFSPANLNLSDLDPDSFIRINLSFKDYGKPYAPEVPAESKNLEEIFGSFFGGME